ncbi:MAG: hypothetical protein Q8868_01870 [Bacteroidota bacterium]|nr:hypothetical protein [Bacteroidota bacterium]
MQFDTHIPEPLLFNPLKHYLPFIREFIINYITDSVKPEIKKLTRELKHIGTCVMDIYTGELQQESIFREILQFLKTHGLEGKEAYMEWTGSNYDSFRIIPLSDSSQWTLKFYEQEARYVHIFPARYSPHTFRIKANTLKSAVLYLILIGKDYITEDDLNKARAMAGLSPIREVADAEAVTEMIEILRG